MGTFCTLVGVCLVAMGFALPIVMVGANFKHDVHQIGGVIAKGVMPHNIPPATAIPGSFDERYQLATAQRD